MGIILFLQLLFLQTISSSLRPGNEPMIFVGLYHQCPGDESTKQQETNICRNAFHYAYNKKSDRHLQPSSNGEFEIAKYIKVQDITFCGIKEVIQIAIDLKLNQSYLISSDGKQNPPKWNNNRIKNWRKTSRILLMLVHATRDVSKFLQEIFYNENFIVRFMNTDIASPLQDRNLFSQNNTFTRDAQNLFSKLNLDSK